MLLRIGPRHCVIPKAAWPVNGKLLYKGWRGGFDKGGFAAVQNHGVDPGNPADEAARTAAVIPGSAVLAIDSGSGEALGVVCKFDKHAAGVDLLGLRELKVPWPR